MTRTIAIRPSAAASATTYLWAAAFVAGNIALPQLCHMAHLGGKAFLPILFFTLIAAARYGLACGIATALLSPLANFALFGMPDAAMLPVVLGKSLIVALIVGIYIQLRRTLSPGRLTMLVVCCALAGFALQTLIQTPQAAWADLVLSWPALLIQVLGGWLVIRALPSAKPARR